MTNSLNLDEIIKLKIEKGNLFVKKEQVNKAAINYKAAIIYVLTNFLKVTDIENLNSDELKEELFDLFGDKNNDMLKQILNQIAPHVKNAIGLSIDVKDYNESRMFYELHYAAINNLYEDLKLRRKKRLERKEV